MQLTISIDDKSRYNAFVQFFRSLDIKVVQDHVTKGSNVPEPAQKGDFFKSFGIWKGRDITIEKIRKNAWPRQK